MKSLGNRNFSNIFINDLFLFVLDSHLSNYTDDNTLYAFGYNLKETENILPFDIAYCKIIKWFEENDMVLNADKCHLCALVRIRKMKLLSLTLITMGLFRPKRHPFLKSVTHILQ